MKSNTMYLDLRVGESVRLGDAQITLAVKSGQRARLVVRAPQQVTVVYPKNHLGTGCPSPPSQMNERDGLLRQFAIAFEGGKEKDKHLVREAIASFNARNPSNRILQIHLAQSISAWKARQTGTQAHPERISE